MEIDKDNLEKALSKKDAKAEQNPEMPKEAEIGFHQGCLNTLVNERNELFKMIQNVEAVMQAHLRRDKMYNGIGIEELKLLSDLGGVVCRFMPLYLADNVDKQYVRGEIKKKPSISDIEGANRFIIKLEKIS